MISALADKVQQLPGSKTGDAQAGHGDSASLGDPLNPGGMGRGGLFSNRIASWRKKTGRLTRINPVGLVRSLGEV